jgi:hypothetical protein
MSNQAAGEEKAARTRMPYQRFMGTRPRIKGSARAMVVKPTRRWIKTTGFMGGSEGEKRCH